MSNFDEKLKKGLASDYTFEIPAAAPGQKRAMAAARQALSIHQNVFVLYRPFSACGKCKMLFERSLEVNPQGIVENDSDSCPHTNKAEYLRTLQSCHDDRWSVMNWREETLKNGTVQVSMTWGVPEDKKKSAGKPRTAPDL